MRRLPIPLVLAAGALSASGGFLASSTIRSRSLVAASAGLWSYSFVLLLLVGGVAIVYGVRACLDEWQALGLMFTGFGCLAYAFAIIATRGLAGWIAFSIIASTGVAHVLRGLEVRRRWT